jgi:hypothetical protein
MRRVDAGTRWIDEATAKMKAIVGLPAGRSSFGDTNAGL